MMFNDDDNNRENKEVAALSLMGTEEVDLRNLGDEELEELLRKLISVEAIDESIENVVNTMKLMESNDEDIIEALSVNLGLHHKEAKEIYNSLIIKER